MFRAVLLFGLGRFRLLWAAVSVVAGLQLAGAIQRANWDGGHIPLNPRSGGWLVEDAFPRLPPTYSVSLALPPGETNRLVLVGMTGVMLEVYNIRGNDAQLRNFLDLSANTFFEIESGLLGAAFHPQFRSNGWVFVYYSWKDSVGGISSYYNRLSRFTIPAGGDGRPDRDSEVVLFSQPDIGPNHNAGCLVFGKDGYLYVSVGDGSVGPDRVVQTIDGGFFGGILRIDVDRKPGNLPPNPGYGVNQDAYSVPIDNPFVGLTNFSIGDRVVWSGLDPATMRTEFFAIGMRNPWQMSIDPLSGDLWSNDVGNGSREEVNLVVSGGNYGWPWVEGTLDLITPPVSGTVPPVFEYTHFSGRNAITGSRFYRGSLYPELDGSYLFCDWTGDFGHVKLQGANPPLTRWLGHEANVVAFGEDPRDGALLMTPSHDGKIKRLVNDTSAGEDWPEKLSETGLFDNLKPMVPRPGLIPYEINVPFWSDYMIKSRWFAVPGTNQTIGFNRDRPWTFPVGTVWVKHFDRPYYRPETLRFPVETRVLIMTSNGIQGASYRWNDNGSDAELVPAAGASAIFNAWTPDEQVSQTWRFPSRTECLSCHNSANGGPAGFNTAQLNRTVISSGGLLSQLDTLTEAGYFSTPPANTPLMPSLAGSEDQTQTLETRVRSYLAANCAQCHQPGGATRATWDARITTSLEDSGLLNKESVPMGNPSLSLVEPGNPDRSALFLRISQLGQNHMPPLATSELDHAAISLVSRWITNDLPTRPRFSTWAVNWLVGVPAEQAVRSADPDEDGLDNYTEYLLRENPKSPVKWWKPRITADAGGHTMRFPRLSGRRFEVEWSDRLGANAQWQRLERIENDPRLVTADGEAIIPLPEANVRFYRVKVSEQ